MTQRFSSAAMLISPTRCKLSKTGANTSRTRSPEPGNPEFCDKHVIVLSCWTIVSCRMFGYHDAPLQKTFPLVLPAVVVYELFEPLAMLGSGHVGGIAQGREGYRFHSLWKIERLASGNGVKGADPAGAQPLIGCRQD